MVTCDSWYLCSILVVFPDGPNHAAVLALKAHFISIKGQRHDHAAVFASHPDGTGPVGELVKVVKK